jgi:hypothetical protein
MGLGFDEPRGELPTEATASRNSNFETSCANLLQARPRVSELSEIILRGEVVEDNSGEVMLF